MKPAKPCLKVFHSNAMLIIVYFECYGSVPYRVTVQCPVPRYLLASGGETIVTINRQKENNNPDFLQPNYIHVGFQGTA